MPTRQENIKSLITNHHRHLQKLQVKKALYGELEVPTRILLEIEDVEAELSQLEAELAALPASSTPEPELPTTNPFIFGGAVPPHLFYGRHDILQATVQRAGGLTAQSISIVGERRLGKTSLLNYIKAQAGQLFSSDVKMLVIYLDLTKAYCRTRAGLMRALRRELTRVWREPWPKDEDGDLGAFDFALEDLQTENTRLLLCLDEVENPDPYPQFY